MCQSLRETSGLALPRSVDSLTNLSISSPLPFLGQAWPDHSLLGPPAVEPVSALVASSRVGPRPPGPPVAQLPTPFHGRPGLAALGLLLQAPSVRRWICLSGLPRPRGLDLLSGLPRRGSPFRLEPWAWQNQSVP